MNKLSRQEERLDYLLEAFKADSENYKNIEVSDKRAEKEQLLRSLMNVRMPKELPEQVIRVQDEYLGACAEEKGIVRLEDIPLIKDNISIWQGDITKLDVGMFFAYAYLYRQPDPYFCWSTAQTRV